MRWKLLTIAIFLYSGISAFSQTDTGQATFTTMLKVSKNIYMLQSEGGNIGFSFGKDGIFMVDDHFTENLVQMQEDIKKISDQPVRIVVNTHFHSDHTAGNPFMAKAGAVIFSQEKVRDRLKTVMEGGTKKISEAILPTVTFTNDITFYFNNEKIYVFHVANAHTDGDAMVYFTENNVLQTGDVYVNGQYPFIDMENGGSVQGYAKGIQKALSLINPETKIIPGHGAMSTYKDLANSHTLLMIAYKKIAQLALLGKTEDEVAKMKEPLEMYIAKGYQDGFVTGESFIRTLYKEATRGKKATEERLKENEEARKKYDEIRKQQGLKQQKE